MEMLQHMLLQVLMAKGQVQAVFLLSVVIRRDVKNLHLAEEEVPVWEIPHLEDHPEVIFQVILQYIQRILVAVLS